MRRRSRSRSSNWCLSTNPTCRVITTKKATWAIDVRRERIVVVGDDQPQPGDRDREHQHVQRPLGPVRERALGLREPLGPRRERRPPAPPDAHDRQHQDQAAEHDVHGQQSIVAERVVATTSAAPATRFSTPSTAAPTSALTGIHRVADDELGDDRQHHRPVQRPRHGPVAGSTVEQRSAPRSRSMLRYYPVWRPVYGLAA